MLEHMAEELQDERALVERLHVEPRLRQGATGVGAVVGRNDSTGYGVRGFNTNAGIVKSVGENIKKSSPNAIVIVVSLPMTFAHIIATASGITGLTLPGMMLLPGCRAGSSISPMS